MPVPAVHAFGDDALACCDAVELAGRLRRGEVSAAEVVEAAIARAGRVEPLLNAVQWACFDRARAGAERPRSGFFAGVPTFVKDNTRVAGLPTGHGSAAVAAVPAATSDPFTLQYLAQGFIVLGKSTLPEFGLNATTEFAHREATRNPWNRDYSSGASSGGSAALVASGVVPIAHANDGGGSIRIPAACCGLVGLKATRGRHREKRLARMMPVNLLNEGVVTRSVRDTAFFHAEAEKYYRNPALPQIGLVEGPGRERLRIGVWLEPVTGDAIDPATRAAVEGVADLLSDAGHQVTALPAPVGRLFVDDFGLYWSMLAYLFEQTGRHTLDPSFDPARVDGFTRGLSRQFRRRCYRAPWFIRRLRQSSADYARVFERLDIVLSPVLTHTTPRLGYLSPDVVFEELFGRLMRYVGFTPWANASGGPAIALPVGTTPDNLPLSIQLFGGHGRERRLLQLAYAIEERTGLWRDFSPGTT